MSDDIELIRGSGNVFSDFSHANAEAEQLKATLAARIIHVLDARGLTVRAAAELTGTAAADFSRIRRAKLDRFTIDRLMAVLGKLDQRVEVNPRFSKPGDSVTTQTATIDQPTDEPFSDIKETHSHEEQLRRESLMLVDANSDLFWRLDIVQKAMALIFGYTIDHTSRSDDESTAQFLGIRLFNSAASGLKLALSGYYQPAFHQARDILETGYLLDYFRTSPNQREIWKLADRKTRRKLFDPIKIRLALDERDGDKTRQREIEYNKLSELASHATFHGFRLTVRQGSGELGPFVEKNILLAWLEEMVLRLGPSAVMYASQFPETDEKLARFFQEFGTELIAKTAYERSALGNKT
jgi:predicted XRE-type DNA-binding protein